MKIARVLAPVLAVLILLVMTGAPALLGIAQATQPAPPAQQSGAASMSNETNGISIPAAPETAPSPTREDASSAPSLTAAYTVDGVSETSDGRTVSSASADQSAVLALNGGSLTMTNATIQKSGDTTSADQSDLYGLNASVTATSGGVISLSGSAVTSTAEGSSAIFATGKDSAIDVSGITISTTGNAARGLNAANGGKVTARDVAVSTVGADSAALATAGESGAITADKATLTTAGDLSPILYATGGITGNNLTGTAAASQMMVAEGESSISLTDSDLTGAGPNGILLYQRTAGEAAAGTASFDATNCKLTTASDGPFFYVTNTRAEVTLAGSTLTYPSGVLAQVSGNSLGDWGTPGSNGGIFTLNGVGQVLSGDVTVDGISAFSLSLSDGSIYTGSVDEKGEGRSVAVALDNNSSWTLTADAHVDALTDAKADLSNIQSGGFTLYYDASNAANVWLNGRTIALAGGGSLVPEEG